MISFDSSLQDASARSLLMPLQFLSVQKMGNLYSHSDTQHTHSTQGPTLNVPISSSLPSTLPHTCFIFSCHCKYSESSFSPASSPASLRNTSSSSLCTRAPSRSIAAAFILIGTVSFCIHTYTHTYIHVHAYTYVCIYMQKLHIGAIHKPCISHTGL